MSFDFQPTLSDGQLTLRPLEKDDIASVVAAASDPMIWAGHPATDRYKPDIAQAYVSKLLATRTALVVTEANTQAIIGSSSYYVSPDQPGDISIGFTFLIRAHWGGTTNRTMKSLMLDHIFASHDTAWLHVAPTNVRSQKATEKLGAERIKTNTLVLGGSLGEWVCYRLRKADWRG